MFVPGEVANVHVRVNNQSAKDVESLKVKLMRTLFVTAEGVDSKDTDVIHTVNFPEKVKQKGGTFEGDLMFPFPPNVYPSTNGKLIVCACTTYDNCCVLC